MTSRLCEVSSVTVVGDGERGRMELNDRKKVFISSVRGKDEQDTLLSLGLIAN